jgi:hypothetical protein
MYKKYIVRLSEEERGVYQDVVKKLKGSSQKVRRSQILLKADADGPNWTDARIAGKRPRSPSLRGVVTCEADQTVAFQEPAPCREDQVPRVMRCGALA